MRQVSDLLLVGDAFDATQHRRPLLSCCQTFHYRRHGWTQKNRPERTNPNYLWTDDDGWLSLNWVDGPAHLYEWGGIRAWRTAFQFLDRQHARSMATLIHCDQGQSRAPTLALAYLAHTGRLPREPDAAGREFLALYPDWWNPGGIWTWLSDNWDAVLSCPVHTIPD